MLKGVKEDDEYINYKIYWKVRSIFLKAMVFGLIISTLMII